MFFDFLLHFYSKRSFNERVLRKIFKRSEAAYATFINGLDALPGLASAHFVKAFSDVTRAGAVSDNIVICLPINRLFANQTLLPQVIELHGNVRIDGRRLEKFDVVRKKHSHRRVISISSPLRIS